MNKQNRKQKKVILNERKQLQAVGTKQLKGSDY